jgi:cytochrome c2
MPGHKPGLLILLASAILLNGCIAKSQNPQIGQVTTGGSVTRGAQMIQYYGCGSCHIIPGISGAFGQAGTPLSGIAERIYIAGVLQNTPENMIRWIRNPKAVDEKTVMPYLGVTERDAKDISAFLYTLK